MNLAAESMSRLTGDVWNERTCGRNATGVVFWAASDWLCETTALLMGRRQLLGMATIWRNNIEMDRDVLVDAHTQYL